MAPSGGGHCYRADLCNVEANLPIRVLKARATSSTLEIPAPKD